MPKFIKKPVVIEAMEFNENNQSEIILWCHKDMPPEMNRIAHSDYKSIVIRTLEGEIRAVCGDYIIKGVNGEFYPCKPDIFKKTYYTEEEYAEQIAELQAELNKSHNEIAADAIEKAKAAFPSGYYSWKIADILKWFDRYAQQLRNRE